MAGILVVAALQPAAALPNAGPLDDWAAAQSALCIAAITGAEARHNLPPGLLLAIARVESGRPLPPSGALEPWPWTTDSAGAGAFYDTSDAAVAGARAALLRSRNLDVGCMQISLMSHPGAFRSLEEAFDPEANADYAARFLMQLQQGPAGGDWQFASGYYHSATPALAAAYRARVVAQWAGLPAPRASAVPLFRRAVQRGVLRLAREGGAVMVVRAGAWPRIAPVCQQLGGGALRCRVR